MFVEEVYKEIALTVFVRHEKNAEQTNLSREIKNKVFVPLRIAVGFILFIIRTLWIRMYNRRARNFAERETSDNIVRRVASVSPMRNKVINYFTKSGEYRWQPDNCFSTGDCVEYRNFFTHDGKFISLETFRRLSRELFRW